MEKQNFYRFGSHRFSILERCLYRGNEKLRIDARSIDLLQFLIEHRGELITKDRLKAEVWKKKFLANKTIDSAISRVRKVLGDDRDYIECATSRGYYWVCPVTVEGEVDKEADGVKQLIDAGLLAINTSYNNPEQIRKMADFLESIVRSLRRAASIPHASMAEDGRFYMKLKDHDRADFFLNLTRQASLNGAEQGAWLQTLEAVHDNLREAIDYYGSKESTASQELEMIVEMGHYWDIRGRLAEGREKLQTALDRQQEANSAVKANGLVWAGYLAFRQDDYKTADELLSASLQMAVIVGNDECVSFALTCLGSIAFQRREFRESKSLYNDGLKTAQRLNISWLIGRAFHGLGLIAENEGDIAQATKLYRKYLSQSEKTQTPQYVAAALNCLGSIARQEKRYDEARALIEKSLGLMRGIGAINGAANCYLKLGLIEEAVGQPQRAHDQFHKGLVLHREVGNSIKAATGLEGLARTSETLGNGKDAAVFLGEADALRTLAAAPLSPNEQKQYGRLRANIQKKFPREFEISRKSVMERAIIAG